MATRWHQKSGVVAKCLILLRIQTQVAVLPRRARRGRMIADSHRANAPGVCGAESAVSVPNQMLRCFVPGKGFSYLTRDPLRGRMVVTLTLINLLRRCPRITRP
jgi:hypothetical protein